MIAVIASMIDDEVDVTFFFRGPIASAPVRRAELEGETIVWRVSLCGAIGAQLCIICM